MIRLGQCYKYWLGPTLEVVRRLLVVGRRFQMGPNTAIGCSIVFGQMCCFVVQPVCCGNFARLFGVVPMLASVHILVHQHRRLLLGAIFCNIEETNLKSKAAYQSSAFRNVTVNPEFEPCCDSQFVDRELASSKSFEQQHLLPQMDYL